MRTTLLTSLLILSAIAGAHAQVSNPSFESNLTNWTTSGNVGTLTSTFGKTPTNGSIMAYMVAQNDTITGITSSSQVSTATLAAALGTTTTNLQTAAGTGNSVISGIGAEGGSGIFQSITVAAGQTLQFDWTFLTSEDVVAGGNQDDFAFISIDGVITVLGRPDSAFHYIPFNSGALDGSSVESYLFETGDGTGNAATRTSDYNTPPGNTSTNFGAGKFQTFGHTFTSAGTVNLAFGVINVHTSGGSAPSALIIDNIQLGLLAAVPEPGTLALLTLGAVGGLAFLRRRNG